MDADGSSVLSKTVALVFSENAPRALIFPNYTEGSVRVDLSEVGISAAADVSVFNAVGQLVFSKKMTPTDENAIDFSAMPSGIYVVKVVVGSTAFVEKIFEH